MGRDSTKEAHVWSHVLNTSETSGNKHYRAHMLMAESRNGNDGNVSFHARSREDASSTKSLHLFVISCLRSSQPFRFAATETCGRSMTDQRFLSGRQKSAENKKLLENTSVNKKAQYIVQTHNIAGLDHHPFSPVSQLSDYFCLSKLSWQFSIALLSYR